MGFETICCVGDSIANGYWCDRGLGWFGRLQEVIAQKYPKQFGFNNLAMSGDRTRDVYHRVCGEVVGRRPDILVIAVGINDLTIWLEPDGEHDQSAAAREIAWQDLLKVAKQNVAKVLVVGLLPVMEERFPNPDYEDPTWHKNSESVAYNAQIAGWCEKANVEFLDILPDWLSRDYSELFADESHPNGEGHALLCQQVMGKLEALGWVK
jgi:lysophospholipase L1-like esterase